MSTTNVPLRQYDTTTIDPLRTAYANKQTIENLNGVSLFHEPFTHCILSDFLTDKAYENQLYKEVRSKFKFAQKNNDLYKFKQVSRFS